jgi:C4-dicarboxylate-specific signal transduction histidine kinase
LLRDKLRQSKTANLCKAAEMLSSHRDDLAAFLGSDRGRALPDYLVKATAHAEAAERDAIGEVEALSRDIDHVKAIVAAQQSYARTSVHAESFRIGDVVRDAIKIGLSSPQNRAIQVDVEIAEDVPVLTTDRHKVLQILLNVVNNARDAVRETSQPSRRITVRAHRSGDHRIRIEVLDSGTGICAETMKRLFQHGFTTKKDGHGFGLHSSANAATELGGRLHANSDGLDRGATFVLEIPIVWHGRADAAA